MLDFKNKIKLFINYIIISIEFLITIIFILFLCILFLSIFNSYSAYFLVYKFYYDRTYRAYFCNRIGFKFTTSFLRFSLFFPFIANKFLRNNKLKELRYYYWYVVCFFNIPLYFVIFMFILFIFIIFTNIAIKNIKKVYKMLYKIYDKYTNV